MDSKHLFHKRNVEYDCRTVRRSLLCPRIKRMNMKLLLRTSTLALVILTGTALAENQRVEPPNWWIGFNDTQLQLMVYGEDMADSTPSVDYSGVRIERVEKVQNTNYLFVYLQIQPETQPGEITIVFQSGAATTEYVFPLLAKNPDPDYARGFDNSDAIYLITPDRFVNGEPANDNVEGMREQVDRSNKGGRHGGDIRGIINSLDYIDQMGFTAIWLNPLLENDMPEYSYHGYSTTDFYRVDPRYGSNEEYRELVQTARARGIGTIMDMIINHSGSEHWWLKDLPSDDWINNVYEPKFTNHLRMTNQDPNASAYDSDGMSDGWFVDTMPDLNQRNPLMGDYLVQNALWWIEYLGLAGIRMDTWPYPDKDYMADWTRRVMAEYPHFNIVGEEWSANPAIVAYWQRGQSNLDGYQCELPSLMDFPLQEALVLALTTPDGELMFDNSPGGLPRLYRALANDFQYPDPDGLVTFPDNHDMSRIYTQLGEDDDLYRMAMAFYATMRGIPQFYYGTEILMSNTGDDDHGNIRSDFPGGWAGDSKNGFTGKGLTGHELQAQTFVKNLLTWRRDKPVIHTGQLTHFRPEKGTYVYFRHDANDSVMVVLNKNTKETQLELSRFGERLRGYRSALDIISGEKLQLGTSMTLPARSVRVLELSQ